MPLILFCRRISVPYIHRIRSRICKNGVAGIIFEIFIAWLFGFAIYNVYIIARLHRGDAALPYNYSEKCFALRKSRTSENASNRISLFPAVATR